MPPVESPRKGRIGLALAGGGPEGAIYEIGALRALDDALDGVDFNDVPVTVGVSSGALVGACLANGITTAQLVRSVVHKEPGEDPFVPEMFLKPDAREYVGRLANLPALVVSALLDAVRGAEPDTGFVAGLVSRLGRALPVGLFDNRPLREYLHRVFSASGRTDDFRELRNALFVVAADLNSGAAVRFGAPGRDDVPISLAIQASAALPGLYPPVEIDGRHYVDGVLLKTLHASVALEQGAGLVLCVNPIVPVDTAGNDRAMPAVNLVDRGMPTVLSQTFRTLIHSRMDTGMAAYRGRFEDADVVLFEPRRDDYTMFFVNVFSFASRKRVLEHAYRSTLDDLAARRDELEPILGRHGVRFRAGVLERPVRDLWASVGTNVDGAARRGRRTPALPTTVATRNLRDALSDLEQTLDG
jgi:predicted acylesterase/phospholipase RssA